MSNFCEVPVFAAISYPMTAAFFAPPSPLTPSISIFETVFATSELITLRLISGSLSEIIFPLLSMIFELQPTQMYRDGIFLPKLCSSPYLERVLGFIKM